MDANLEWLQQRREHYRAHKNDMSEAIEDFDDLSKLGQPAQENTILPPKPIHFGH
jgi:hypothetical protein